MNKASNAPINDNAIAIDLGTGSTCIACCPMHKGTKLEQKAFVIKPEGWSNAAFGGAIPTVILYKNNKPFLIGAAAEHEFGEATPAERQNYMLRSQFKPDVAVSAEARRYMEDFLRLLCSKIEQPQSMLAGLPCLAENHYRQALRQCYANAGFKDVLFLREPLGAVINAVAGGALSPSMAAKGLLVVDFGGGTCDLAILRRADVIGCQGDMLYGGRLFDDLIYQILLQRNPKLEAKLKSGGNEHYVHWIACRAAKEEFSRIMAADLQRKASLRVRWSFYKNSEVQQESAYIADLGWDEFLELAGNYRASKSFLSQLLGHADRAGHSAMAEGMLAGKKVDLISWFEHILVKAIDQSGLSHSLDGIPTVLLTGGSSSWPFVQQIVKQTLGDFSKIYSSAEPYADIAKGLAQHHALSACLRQGREALKIDLPLFMENNIRRKIIRQGLEKGTARIWADCAELLRNVVILPEFTRFREEGGQVQVILTNLVEAAKKEEENMAAILAEGMARLAQNIAEECRAELRAWFAEKGIPILPEKLEQSWFSLEMHVFLNRLVQDMGTEKLLGARAAGDIMASAAALGLGSIAAIGTLSAGFAVGIAGLLLLKFYKADKWMVTKLMALPLPARMRKMLFNNNRALMLCNQQLESFGNAFHTHIISKWQEVEGRILAEAARVAQEEIAALDVLDISPS